MYGWDVLIVTRTTEEDGWDLLYHYNPSYTSCPNTLFITQILTKSDGLDEPHSLRINIDRNELLVCNKRGPAFLFSLQYM